MRRDRDGAGTKAVQEIGSLPTVALVLALAPALAVPPLVAHAFVLSLTVVVTLFGCRLFIDALERWIPDHLSTMAYLVAATVLVTLIDVLTRIYLSPIATGLGIVHPMMIVSCLILSRRRPAIRRQPTPADSLRTGFHFAIWLIGVSFVRELVGRGTITLLPLGGFNGVLIVPVLSEHPFRIVALAPGGFLVLGYLLAIRNARASRLSQPPEPANEALEVST